MKIFEIDKGKYLNLDNVFKFELIKLEDGTNVFWRFYVNDDSFINSKNFSSSTEARNWLDITVIRASSANEIIKL